MAAKRRFSHTSRPSSDTMSGTRRSLLLANNREEMSMCRQFLHDVLIVAIAIFGALFVAGDLVAQDPGAPKPTPITIPPAKVVPPPLPIEKQPGPESARINPLRPSPDLELTLRPSSSTSIPREFIVKNSGSGDSRNASLLSVRLVLLPMTDVSRRALYAALHGFSEVPASVGEPNPSQFHDDMNRQFQALCGYPYRDFQAAIDPLAAGETQRISQSGARVEGGNRPIGAVATLVTTRVPDHSYIEQIEIRLVCVYEVRAFVDANREVAESNERNNEVIHTFQRKVTLR